MEAWRVETFLTLSLILTSMLSSASATAITSTTTTTTASNGDLLSHLSTFHAMVHEITPDQVYSMWLTVRAKAIAPALQMVVWMCMVMSVMLVVEATYMALVSLGVKIIGWKPEKQYKWEAIGQDEEKGSSAYPLVLVQIPMFNEIEVYKLSIGAACGLTWPSDRIIIQVLDDSTDPLIKDLVKVECETWASKGVNIKYCERIDRKGFKAGALKKGMEFPYAQECDYVVIFDADFQPEPDYLNRTVPFLIHNPKIALVQARWDFVNYSMSLLTRIQKMSLDYHFKVEQESGSATFAFFSFNGTAGVWRVSAINEAGGWKDRTTVEDMDLAVRATLKGWKFLYINELRVKSELPTTFKAYCRQQHRWVCGAANLFRKMAWDIIVATEVSLVKKFYMLYSFFLVRRVVAPVVSFVLYCLVLPLSVLVPEVYLPIWGVAYIPTTLLFITAIRHPKSLHLMPFWILFENVMSLHRIKAAMVGLFETATFNEWIVTKKVGNNLKDTLDIPLLEKSKTKLRDKINLSELGFSAFLFFCASYNLAFGGTNSYYINLYMQATAFLVLGFNYVGTCYCASFH
ncbi:cellulose synthase like [Rhynchospora pubera]|uniref:glucomannan 4-beta-mannosyltransferase n=1 Tax=Rhynchospora pubera TaxID=906938 RepID=A0AAV8CD56_9POAL|nr:cellulose synthase like [Rhynchospora pubera]